MNLSSGSYKRWLEATATKWAAATETERSAARSAARDRHAQRNAVRPKALSGDATVLLVYDEIGFWGITAADVVSELQGIQGDLELHLNTPGGEVHDGIAIANALKQRSGQVRVVVDGLAASIGSVIAMAASPGELVMAPNSSMMIHEAWGLCIGPASDMTQMAGILDQTSANIADIYAARSGKPAAGWRDVMKAESWMVGQQAVDAGLADRMGDAAPDAAAEQAAAWTALIAAAATPEKQPAGPQDPGQADLDARIAAIVRAELLAIGPGAGASADDAQPPKPDPGPVLDPGAFSKAFKEAFK